MVEVAAAMIKIWLAGLPGNRRSSSEEDKLDRALI